MNATSQHHGWVSSSNDRGTLDIIVSCAVTTFLCIWTCVCVNVPAPGRGAWDLFRDRWHMFCLGLLGPEFIVLLAVGQYCSAKSSTEAFRQSKHPLWTMRHSYFADMGGVHMRFPGWEPFPVNAKQLHHLVTNGHIPYPEELTLVTIQDKNKSDGLSRFISTAQISWFTLSTLTRPIKHLAITTIEITTLAYIFCGLLTLFFWRNKPMDILCPIVLSCSVPIEQILGDRAGTGHDWYHFTPLDCLSRQEWIGSRLWTYYVNILRRMSLVLVRPRNKPIQRFSSFNFPMLTRPMIFLMLLLGFTYSAIFLSAWNLHYPSHTEKVLWRLSSLGTAIIVLLGGVFEVAFIFWDPWKTPSRPPSSSSRSDIELVERTQRRVEPETNGSSSKFQEMLANIRNNSPNKDPALEIPIRSLLFTTPLCALYTIFRFFILVEDGISLRELPLSAFVAIEWSVYVPHI